MCQHRLRFYAQARTEVADRASQERTLTDILVGTTVGTIGSEMGTIGANQETRKKRQECIETQQKESVLRVSDGVDRATDSINKWTILDSNQRPPRCQRFAWWFTSGRYWTRTNDPHDVNAALPLSTHLAKYHHATTYEIEVDSIACTKCT